MKEPSFSVVVPTFQRRDVVCEAARAIARIEYAGPLELVVIVDGSTDGTVEALEAIACPFPKKVIFQENAGLARARNRGAAEASGEILLFLDDDMICDPDIVSQHARSHRAGADAVLGHIPLDPASPAGVLADGVGKWAESRAAKLSRGAPLTLFDLLGGHLSVRCDVFNALGGFDQAFTAGGSYGNEDIDFGARLIAGHTILFNRDAVAWHRYVVTPSSHMRQYFEAGQAAVDFSRKHPVLGQDLFELFGARTLRARLLLRPLASVAWITALVRKGAVALARHYVALPPILKSVVRKLFFNARDLVYWSGVHSRGGIPRSDHALILCYHAIADLAGDPILAEYGIPPQVFEQQLDRLRARRFTFISPGELAVMLEEGGKVPANSVLLTFDDCYSELIEIARSILAPRGIPALAFAVSGMASDTNEWDNAAGSRSLALLDGVGLRELASLGVEVGCHSRTHRPLPEVANAELSDETLGAADDLVDGGVQRPRFFAYPHGLSDPHSRAAVRSAGFIAAFGLRRGLASNRSDRFNLPRLEIFARDVGWRFGFKTACPKLSLLLDWRDMGVRARRRILRDVRAVATKRTARGR